ncbi:MAG: penicillin acylase family protein, partial [Flavobacteriales bacterium]|nr:penicillin acylase family protein [Flavobacteriales bacterium]
YAITGAMAYNFSQAQKTDFIIDDLLHRLGPDYLTDLAILHDSTESYIPDFRPDTSFRSPETAFAQAMAHVENLLPYAPLNGSNSWVLSGQKTASGKVIFCNDTHIGYLVPQTWYEAILECPDLHIHGHFMAGIPFALVGTTSKLSWGLTMLLNDDMDFYRETQDKNDPDRVIYKGNSVPLEVHAYKIPVKDADSAEVVVRTTPHGPLINAVVEGMQELPPTSLFWTYTKVPNHNIEALFGLNHARNMDEFASHLPLIHGPGLSVNYGDSEGNIAWWACAHLLKRPPHVQSFTLLDGASGQDEPLGYYPFANNPRCINPPSGYIYSANDWPQAIDTTGSISGDLDYWYPGYYKPQYRADRINKLLQANDAWTTTSIQSVMNDITNTTDSALYAQLWGIILSTGKLSDQLDIADFATLFKWNGSYGREQIQPSIFSRWLYHTMRLACEDEMGKENFRLFISGHLYQRAYSRLITSANSLWWDNVSTSDSRESRQAIVVAALECTLGELKQHYGPETKMWQWRKLTSVEFQHPMGKVGVFRPFFNIGPM